MHIQTGDPVIHLQVLFGGAAPGEIGGHTGALEGVPGILVVVVEVDGLADNPHHIMCVDVGEGESGGVVHAAGADGVAETAGLTDHGQGAVPHGDDLGQAAGLGDAGHEEEISAAVDSGGQGAGVHDVGGEAAGILGLSLTEGLLKVPVAGAHDHHLRVGGHDVMDGGGHQLEALVLDQTGDAGDDGHVGIFPQAHGALQGGLTGGLAGQVVDGEVLSQTLIVGGIIETGVDAVEDTAQLVAVVGDDALQAVGVEGVLQLLGVGGGDGGHIVGGVDGALHQVHIAVIAEHMLVEVAGVETEEVFQGLLAVPALVLDVVDGVDRLGVVELGHAVALFQQVDGHQSGLPVVAVEHLGMPVQVARGLDDGAGEEGEALAVVIVAIDAGTLEVIFVVHEVVGDIVALELENAAVRGTPSQADVEVEEVGHLAAPLLTDALIEGEDDAHVMTAGGQSLRQAAGDVCETAGFDKGGHLGGSKQDVHSKLLSWAEKDIRSKN